jgi:hypothetical protein
MRRARLRHPRMSRSGKRRRVGASGPPRTQARETKDGVVRIRRGRALTVVGRWRSGAVRGGLMRRRFLARGLVLSHGRAAWGDDRDRRSLPPTWQGINSSRLFRISGSCLGRAFSWEKRIANSAWLGGRGGEPRRVLERAVAGMTRPASVRARSWQPAAPAFASRPRGGPAPSLGGTRPLPTSWTGVADVPTHTISGRPSSLARTMQAVAPGSWNRWQSTGGRDCTQRNPVPH